MDKLDEKLKELKKKNRIESDELSAVERSKLENEYQKLKNDVNKISKTKGSLIKNSLTHSLTHSLTSYFSPISYLLFI